MSFIDHPSYESKNISALGVWKDEFSIILRYRGSTFHNLTLGRSFNRVFLNLEETVFALLRTNFILLDYRDKRLIGPNDILHQLVNDHRIPDLLKIHVYLGFQRLGKSPRSLQDSIPSNLDFNPDLYSFDNFVPKNEHVELHSLLDFFRTLKLTSINYKTELSRPVYHVDNLECFITMPDALVSNILDNSFNFNKIIAVSDLDSVYFLTLSPLIF